jgi:transposase-like protein
MDKFTLSDFLNRYSSNEACLEEIKKIRFPHGISCKVCKKRTKHYKIKGRMQYACSKCGRHIAPLSGTIFEKTSTPLTSWFYVMFLMINTRAGISAKQIQRELGVTYKTAWRMGKQIRTLMADTDMVFDDGIVEMDETYIGGKPRLKERWDTKTKEVVMGMVQRDGKVFLKHVEGAGKWTVLDQVKAHIDPKVRVITDEWPSYTQLKYHGYNHDVIRHRKAYVKNDIHTQNIENVWSRLKRGIYGVYRHVSKKYLQAYADEFAFRYNNRKQTQRMFRELLTRIPDIRMVSVKPLFLRAS